MPATLLLIGLEANRREKTSPTPTFRTSKLRHDEQYCPLFRVARGSELVRTEIKEAIALRYFKGISHGQKKRTGFFFCKEARLLRRRFGDKQTGKYRALGEGGWVRNARDTELEQCFGQYNALPRFPRTPILEVVEGLVMVRLK